MSARKNIDSKLLWRIEPIPDLTGGIYPMQALSWAAERKIWPLEQYEDLKRISSGPHAGAIIIGFHICRGIDPQREIRYEYGWFPLCWLTQITIYRHAKRRLDHLHGIIKYPSKEDMLYGDPQIF